ncbi:hypothetical protein BDV96DRAFT_651985 [Lophiotrema nucula]|uniref:Uncharacterized protein n=1 Tax=Lophiotrema nucula TaxID=690887 RepID=A0A6A5YSV2_9PLEO|nr:hypothetical protein BDV96DRAFT_651985 [Lophiotrema nucula]
MAPAPEMARAAPLPRIPKLAYRNPLPADQVSLSSASTSASETPSNEASSEQRLSTPSSTGTSSPVRPSFESRSLTSPSLASSNASVSTSTKSAKKKKAGAVRGFLTLKEPSQSAFEQFAEQQRKQQADKGGKTTPNGNGISPQKLPATVPKVNSKWDGLPDTKRNSNSIASARKRDSTQSTGWSTTTSRRSAAPSTSISVYSSTSDGSRGPPNTVSSALSSDSSIPLSPGASNSPGERRDSGPSISRSEKYSSPSTTTLPEITYFFPDNPNVNGALPGSFHGSVDKHPSLTLSSLSGSSNTPSSNSGGAPSYFDASNPRTTTMYSGQVSQDTDIDIRAVLRRASAANGFLAGEAQEIYFADDGSSILTKEEEEPVNVPEEEESVIVEQVIAITTPTASPLPSPLPSPSLGGGFPRFGPMNFSRPLSSQTITPTPDVSRLSVGTFVNRAGVTELPTLYEASTASSSNTTVNQLPNSRPRKDSDAASLASSVTPSEMSASWYRTSRERLGLGGRIRKSDVLPWEPSEENVPDLDTPPPAYSEFDTNNGQLGNI